jgi:hypothetical protein
MGVTPLLAVWLLSGCPSGDGPGATCSSTAQCTRRPLTECVEGVCTEVIATAATTCQTDADCGERERCAGDICALTPSCQRIDGDFRFIAQCPSGNVSGPATAVTDDCIVTFSGSAGAPFSIGFAQVPAFAPVEDDLLLLAGCVGTGRFAAAESAALLSGCDIGNETCDVALIADAVGADPCFDNSDCLAGCAPLSQLQGGAGSCQ